MQRSQDLHVAAPCVLQTCAAIQKDTGATFVPPYNHPRVIAGQGTIALEFLEQARGWYRGAGGDGGEASRPQPCLASCQPISWQAISWQAIA